MTGPPPIPSPLRLTLDRRALADNWRWLARQGGGAACGAAVKADGYGLGAKRVAAALTAAGCRDLFVATWAEAAALDCSLPPNVGLSVLHGVREADMAFALASRARPVLVSAAQVARWRAAAPDRPCDVMIDTGMNRLGLSPAEARSGLLDGLAVDTLHSHLSSADEDGPVSAAQRDAFVAATQGLSVRRRALANSAGICLGPAYAFDLTRPGLALYGGVPRAEAVGQVRPVAAIAAEVLQVRDVAAGEAVGYNHTFVATRPMRVGVIQLGYADGWARALSGQGHALFGNDAAPVLGRISMDLITLDFSGLDVGEGDNARFPIDPVALAAASGRSQYEVLTSLGARFGRD